MPLIVRYIDNIFTIILVGGYSGFTLEKLNELKSDINDFGILKWNIDEPPLQVDYLDLTLQLVDGYIHPNSAHPSLMIQGMVTSMIKGYYHQNTSLDDFWDVSTYEIL